MYAAYPEYAKLTKNKITKIAEIALKYLKINFANLGNFGITLAVIDDLILSSRFVLQGLKVINLNVQLNASFANGLYLAENNPKIPKITIAIMHATIVYLNIEICFIALIKVSTSASVLYKYTDALTEPDNL